MTRSRETDPTEFRDTRTYFHLDAIFAHFSSKETTLLSSSRGRNTRHVLSFRLAVTASDSTTNVKRSLRRLAPRFRRRVCSRSVYFPIGRLGTLIRRDAIFSRREVPFTYSRARMNVGRYMHRREKAFGTTS